MLCGLQQLTERNQEDAAAGKNRILCAMGLQKLSEKKRTIGKVKIV